MSLSALLLPVAVISILILLVGVILGLPILLLVKRSARRQSAVDDDGGKGGRAGSASAVDPWQESGRRAKPEAERTDQWKQG